MGKDKKKSKAKAARQAADPVGTVVDPTLEALLTVEQKKERNDLLEKVQEFYNILFHNADP